VETFTRNERGSEKPVKVKSIVLAREISFYSKKK
jgi:hypothetical protein